MTDRPKNRASRRAASATAAYLAKLGIEPIRETSAFLITPEIAAALLKHNRNVRPLRAGHVEKLSRDMGRGDFPFTGAPILVDRHGNVLDGQHRLTACVQCDVGFMALVVQITDVAAALLCVDADHAARKATVATRDIPFEDAALATGIATKLFKAENFGLGAMVRGTTENTPSRHELNRIATENQAEIAASLEPASSVSALIPPRLAGAIWILTNRLSPERAERFFLAFATGANLRADSPLRQARERLIALQMQKLQGQRLASTCLVLVVKAWNKWLSGSTQAIRVELAKPVPEFRKP